MFLLAIKLSSQNDTINRSFEEAGKSKVLMEKVKTEVTQIPDDRDIDEQEVTIDTVNNKYKNSIELSCPFTYIQVPFKGFFRNNRLFNISMYGLQLNYYRNFRKSTHWSWGVTLGYELYKVTFYNMYGKYMPPKTSGDTAWYRNKYNTADAFTNQVMYNYNPQSKNLHDSMLKYYGGPTKYLFDVIRIGYALKYSKKLGKKYTLHFALESSYTINKITIGKNNILLRSNDYGASDGSVYLNDAFEEIPIYFVPIMPIYTFLTTTYSKMSREWNDNGMGMLKYTVGFDYTIFRNQSVSINFSWANLIVLREPSANEYNDFKPFYYYLRWSRLNWGGYSLLPYEENRGHFNIPITPNLYRRFQLSLNYMFKF